jgi:hypothetical protein
MTFQAIVLVLKEVEHGEPSPNQFQIAILIHGRCIVNGLPWVDYGILRYKNKKKTSTLLSQSILKFLNEYSNCLIKN